MAAEDEKTDQPETDYKKRWLIIGSVAGLALIIIILGLFVFLRSDPLIETEDSTGSGRAGNEQVDVAFYVPLQRNFIFNVPGAQRDRVAQISVQLMVRGNRNERLTQENIPLIEGTLLQVFSRATAERLNSPEGKREIRLQALDAVREAMRDVTNGSPVIEEVLFTGFVLQ